MAFCFERRSKHGGVTLKLFKCSLVLYATSLLHKGLDKDFRFVLKYLSKHGNQAISSFFWGGDIYEMKVYGEM